MERRKLYLPGQFYSCIISQGAHLGGLNKKIASLLKQSRDDSLHLEVQVGEKVVTKDTCSSWIELLENYSDYRDKLERTVLPSIRVRINQKEIRQVLSAEQSVSFNAIRRRKKNFAQSTR